MPSQRKRPPSKTLHWMGEDGRPLCNSTAINANFADKPGQTSCTNCQRNQAFPGKRVVRARPKGETVWIPAQLVADFRAWLATKESGIK